MPDLVNHHGVYDIKSFQLEEWVSPCVHKIPMAECDSLQRRLDQATVLNGRLIVEKGAEREAVGGRRLRHAWAEWARSHLPS